MAVKECMWLAWTIVRRLTLGQKLFRGLAQLGFFKTYFEQVFISHHPEGLVTVAVLAGAGVAPEFVGAAAQVMTVINSDANGPTTPALNAARTFWVFRKCITVFRQMKFYVAPTWLKCDAGYRDAAQEYFIEMAATEENA
jgi:hypothetical protein